MIADFVLARSSSEQGTDADAALEALISDPPQQVAGAPTLDLTPTTNVIASIEHFVVCSVLPLLKSIDPTIDMLRSGTSPLEALEGVLKRLSTDLSTELAADITVLAVLNSYDKMGSLDLTKEKHVLRECVRESVAGDLCVEEATFKTSSTWAG